MSIKKPKELSRLAASSFSPKTLFQPKLANRKPAIAKGKAANPDIIIHC